MIKTKLTILSLALASAVVMARDFKLAFVNIDRILSEAKPSRAIGQSLQQKYAAEESALQALNDKLKQEQVQISQINEVSHNAHLSKLKEEQLKKLQAQLQSDQAKFQQKYLGFQQNFQRSQQAALAILMDKVNTIFKNLSEEYSYDLVLTSNQLVYAKAKYDITDQVMARLNNIDSQSLVKEMQNALTAPANPAAAPSLINPKLAK